MYFSQGLFLKKDVNMIPQEKTKNNLRKWIARGEGNELPVATEKI
jgi:hypothetical protein